MLHIFVAAGFAAQWQCQIAPCLDRGYKQTGSTNAVQAMSTVPPETRRLFIRSSASGDGVAVEVQDSGPGLSPEVEARLFTPFFTTKEEGFGLGLSITQSIFEAHGGRIAVVPGTAGATFRFELPAGERCRISDETLHR